MVGQTFSDLKCINKISDLFNYYGGKLFVCEKLRVLTNGTKLYLNVRNSKKMKIIIEYERDYDFIFIHTHYQTVQYKIKPIFIKYLEINEKKIALE